MFIILIGLFFLSCSSSDEKSENLARAQNISGEYIYRMHHEYFLRPDSPKKNPKTPYPWDNQSSYAITKEYFRCKGSSLNPARSHLAKEGPIQIYDCPGCDKHSLPLREGKEFIYPILINLLNYIQTKSNQKVIITSGHRCPAHNLYVDSAKDNLYSKHMIGAEVSFYVQSLENQPEKIINWIENYYQETDIYKNKNEFLKFTRYTKETNVSTQPWMNKEIFVKIFRKKEGRNFDNRHPYPYISIQVRYDYDKKEPVTYTWDKANRNYLRH